MRRPLCVVCLAFILAISLFQVFYPLSVPDFSCRDGQEYLLSGQVYHKEYRNYFGSKTLIIHLKNVSLLQQNNNQKEVLLLDGMICYMKGETEPKMGADVLVRGKWKSFERATNPGQFDTAKYYYIMKLTACMQGTALLKESQKHHPLEETLYQLKGYFGRKLEQHFAEENAAVLKAMLLGDKTTLPIETRQLYKQSGIIHILSVSGLHVSLIGMSIYKLLRKVGSPIPLAAGISVILLLLYGMMIGMGTSAFRAIFMFVLSMMADSFGRTYDLITALFLAAVLLLIEQPFYLYHSGFMLSFGSVLSIGAWYPVLEWKPPGWPKGAQKSLSAMLVSLSVFLGTLPIHMCFYYEVPVYSIFLNLFIIPCMTLVAGCGFAVILLPEGLNFLISLAVMADRMALYLFSVTGSLSLKLPGAAWITGRPANWQVLLYYAGMLILICFKDRVKYGMKVLAVGILVLLLSVRIHTGLEITFLDVGQGDGIFIQCENGNAYLIDGGSSSCGKVGEDRIVPFLKYKGVKQIEAVFLSHADADHCSGIMELLELGRENIRIKRVVLPDIAKEDKQKEFGEIIELAKESGAEISYMKKGTHVEDGKLRMSCLHPKKGYSGKEANAYSQVLLLEYGTFCTLFTGDVEGEGEKAMMQELALQLKARDISSISVLKVSHHGSKNSTTTEFLKLTKPQYAVISCGKKNQYGHPHEEVIQRLKNQNIQILKTSEKGAVTIKQPRFW